MDSAGRKGKKRKKVTKTKTKSDQKSSRRHNETNGKVPAANEEEVQSESSGSEKEDGGENFFIDDEAKADDIGGPGAENADEKRLRLAKQYLEKLREEEENEQEEAAGDFGKDAIAHRLQQDALEAAGRSIRYIADKLVDAQFPVRTIRAHQLSVTAVTITHDGATAFSASKDCSLVKYDVETGKRTTYKGSRKGDGEGGHNAQVLSVAVSSDGKFLASGGLDRLVRIWDPRTDKLLESFKGHRDSLSAVAFRDGTHALYSGSSDRTVKLWNLDEMAYVETLFGHQSPVTAIDSLARERCVTSGGSDKTVRVWKIIEETQLVFRGGPGSIDAIAYVTDDSFVSGAQDGSLSVWSTLKKKPVATVPNAHTSAEHWICSVAACPYTDLIASGSWDGHIRLWRLGRDGPVRSLEQVAAIPVAGFVNGLRFSRSGRVLVAGVGQEHRLGRWFKTKDAKNGIRIISLPSLD